MFKDIRNACDDHWGPSSGSMPQETEEQPEDDNDKEEHMDDNADSDGNDDTPSSSKGKKRRVADKDNKSKKAKTTRGQWMQDQMAKIVQLNEKTSASCESIVLAKTQ